MPPHSTGGAVDVDIVDAAGQPLDFGMALSDWGGVAPELCATQYPGLTDTAARHRQLLVEVMTAAGLVNYPQEYWHFSYDDQYWACVTGCAQARCMRRVFTRTGPVRVMLARSEILKNQTPARG